MEQGPLGVAPLGASRRRPGDNFSPKTDRQTDWDAFAQVRAHLGPEFARLTLAVTLDQPYLVDVGYGDSFRAPMPLVAVVQSDVNGLYRLAQGEWPDKLVLEPAVRDHPRSLYSGPSVGAPDAHGQKRHREPSGAASTGSASSRASSNEGYGGYTGVRGPLGPFAQTLVA